MKLLEHQAKERLRSVGIECPRGRVARSPEEAAEAARQILGMEIRGYTVPSVLCEEALEIAREIYLGVTVDRDRRGMVVILSFAGGMEIEEVGRASCRERVFRVV